MCKDCRYIRKAAIVLDNGKIYDECAKSRRDLPHDICNPESSFCKAVSKDLKNKLILK